MNALGVQFTSVCNYRYGGSAKTNSEPPRAEPAPGQKSKPSFLYHMVQHSWTSLTHPRETALDSPTPPRQVAATPCRL